MFVREKESTRNTFSATCPNKVSSKLTSLIRQTVASQQPIFICFVGNVVIVKQLFVRVYKDIVS